MHILLGFLGSIVTILFLLSRLTDLGIDLGWLNPFHWWRRRQWRKRVQGNPVYTIDSPMQATALMATAAAKADGEMSSDDKQQLLSLFQHEFSLNEKAAADLLASSGYLLGRGDEVQTNVETVLKPSLPNFTAEQVASATELLDAIAASDATGAQLKQAFVERVKGVLEGQIAPAAKWR